MSHKKLTEELNTASSLESMPWTLTVLWKRIKSKIWSYNSITNINIAVPTNILVQQKPE